MSTTVERREVVLHGHPLSYRQRGEVDSGNPVVVLLHGLASSSSTWREVLGRLPEDVTAIAPDLPGHGKSEGGSQDYTLAGHANIVRDLLVAIGVERATLAGHSYGGGVAMQLAYQHPERCERLVLVSSGGLGPDVSWMLRLLSLPGAELVLPVIAPAFVRDAGYAVGRLMHKVGIRAPRIEESWNAYASLAEPDNRGPFLRTLRGVVGPSGQTLSAKDRLYLAAALPTLIVWGARDRMVPVTHAAAAQESLPNSEVVILDHSAHFPHHEEPDAFIDALTGFLDRSAAQAGA